MVEPPNEPAPARRGFPPLAMVFAAAPVLALTVGIPFANRLEPYIFGLPFLLAWIVCWIVLTPVCMTIVHRLDRRRP